MVKEAAVTNTEIIRRLHTRAESHHAHSPSPNLLTQLCTSDEVTAEYALGPLASKLRSVISVIDLEHPDIGDLFDGLMAKGSDFANEYVELFRLAGLAVASDCCHIGPSLWKLAKELPKEVLRKIDSPLANRLNVRFLKSAEDRRAVRASKRMQAIDLRSLCRKGEEVWNAQPCDFSRFIRFDMAYEEELARIDKKAKRYQDLGCTDLYSEIMKTVETFKQQVEDSYYGFNRVTMTSAAVVLAKMHRYNLYQPFLLADFNTHREYRIVVESRTFSSYNFVPESEIVQTNQHTLTGVYNYEPRVYPFHELMDLAPPLTREIIDIVDAFPEAGGRPIFDHFGVIVPGFDCPNERNNRIVNPDGEVLTFSNLEDGKKALDGFLIRGQHIVPIVVGERDGRCYFISYLA